MIVHSSSDFCTFPPIAFIGLHPLHLRCVVHGSSLTAIALVCNGCVEWCSIAFARRNLIIHCALLPLDCNIVLLVLNAYAYLYPMY